MENKTVGFTQKLFFSSILLIIVMFSFLACTQQSEPNKDKGPDNSNIVSKFSVFGDTPSSAIEISRVNQILAETSDLKMPFLVHLGDIFSGTTECDETIYLDRKKIFSSSKVPILMVIGDNEYIDCPDPEQAISLYRQIILGNPNAKQYIQGQDSSVPGISVERQESLIENFSWEYQNIHFVSLTFPRFPGKTPLSDTKISEILEFNRIFLNNNFETAKAEKRSSIVISMHANPMNSCSLVPCFDFKRELISLIEKSDVPVLMINGDKNDKAFEDGNYQGVEHFWHLRPGGKANEWAEVSFSTQSNKFSVIWHPIF